MAPVLLSRSFDFALGILTGVGAYYLHENHPRTGLKPEERLVPLILWKWNKSKSTES